ncbi:MAG: glycosyltransferase family 4 protein [Promethearchaeota archaeon]
MKICYLADAQTPHTQKWVKYFRDQGHKVIIISRRPARIKGVKIYYIPDLLNNFKISLLFHIFKVRKIINKERPDILHVLYASSYGALAYFSKLDYLITCWGSDIFIDTQSKINLYFVKKILKKAKKIIVVSSILKEKINNFGIKKDISIIPDGINLNKFKKINKKSNKFIIVSTRNLEPIYSIDTLIKAAKIVLNNVKNKDKIIFKIIGDGSLENDLIKLSNKLTLNKNIKFYGRLPHDKVIKELLNSNIYVSTSLSDGTSVSLLEAMAAKLPVIVTDIKANKIWVKGDINGELFPKKNYQRLAKKIIYLTNNPSKRLNYGKENYKIVKEKGNFKKLSVKMENLYNLFKSDSSIKNKTT